MFHITFVIFCTLTIVLVDSRNSVIPQKCDFSDVDCKKNMYQRIFRYAADGVPSEGIPKADPMELRSTVVLLPNSVKLTLKDGIVTGFKNCEFNSLRTYLEKPFHTSVNLTCDILVNGKYDIEIPGPRSDVCTRSGNGKVIMDKLHVLVDVPFHLEFKDDNIYVHGEGLHIYHDSHDSVVFSIDDFEECNNVNSELITKFLKQNAVELNLFSTVTERMLEFLEVFVKKYISTIPAKDIITSDVSSYL